MYTKYAQKLLRIDKKRIIDQNLFNSQTALYSRSKVIYEALMNILQEQITVKKRSLLILNLNFVFFCYGIRPELLTGMKGVTLI